MGLDSLGDNASNCREIKGDPLARKRIMSGELASRCRYVRPGQVIKAALKIGPGKVNFIVKEI